MKRRKLRRKNERLAINMGAVPCGNPFVPSGAIRGFLLTRVPTNSTPLRRIDRWHRRIAGGRSFHRCVYGNDDWCYRRKRRSHGNVDSYCRESRSRCTEALSPVTSPFQRILHRAVLHSGGRRRNLDRRIGSGYLGCLRTGSACQLADAVSGVNYFTLCHHESRALFRGSRNARPKCPSCVGCYVLSDVFQQWCCTPT